MENTISIDMKLTRRFRAPVEMVWKAWTDPKQLMKWWGPESFSAPAITVDLRVGGKFHFCMQAPDGHKIWSTGVYLEIEENKKIVYTDSFADEKGNAVSSKYYVEFGFPDNIAFERKVTLEFEAIGNETVLTILHAGHSSDMQESLMGGWNSSLNKMANILLAVS